MARDLPLSALNRFRDKTNKTETCWLWVGSIDSSGYGSLSVGSKEKKRKLLTHRIAYTLAKGDPGNLQVLHTCDNPRCVNPDHLFLGTHEDNMQDRKDKGRYDSVSGEKSSLARYPDQLVTLIMSQKDSGRTQQDVANEFKVSNGYVSRLWSGKRRKI